MSTSDPPEKYHKVSLSTMTQAEFGVLSKDNPSSTSFIKPEDGYLPLHLTAQNNHEKDTSFLLSQPGALVDGLPKHLGGCGCTPLHRASYSGALSTMRLLIDANADMLAIDESFVTDGLMTPLHKAISGGRYKAVKLLLEALELKSNDDDNILSKALSILDSEKRTPLELSIELSSKPDQEIEKQSVARWNVIAGEPDFEICMKYMKEAHTKLQYHGIQPVYDVVNTTTTDRRVTKPGNSLIPENENNIEIKIHDYDDDIKNCTKEAENHTVSFGKRCVLCDNIFMSLRRDKKNRLVCRQCFKSTKIFSF